MQWKAVTAIELYIHPRLERFVPYHPLSVRDFAYRNGKQCLLFQKSSNTLLYCFLTKTLFPNGRTVVSPILQFQSWQQYISTTDARITGVTDSQVGGGGRAAQQTPATIRTETSQCQEKSM